MFSFQVFFIHDWTLGCGPYGYGGQTINIGTCNPQYWLFVHFQVFQMMLKKPKIYHISFFFNVNVNQLNCHFKSYLAFLETDLVIKFVNFPNFYDSGRLPA